MAPNDTELRPIAFDELENLQLDKENHLYWKGEPVVTKEIVNLAGIELLLAVIVAIATAVMGIESLLRILGKIK